jgi:hypothetical protein
MLEPKPLPSEALPAALDKALRYRLLNEPLEAESICRDVLRVDPASQEALVTLLLALTDQFERRLGDSLDAAKQVIPQLAGQYKQAYYEGIVYERWGKAQLARGLPAEMALNWFRAALRCYERAESLAPRDDPDAILRWNACVRILNREAVAPSPDHLTRDVQAAFGDEMPER